jgi:hypothetical protein
MSDFSPHETKILIRHCEESADDEAISKSAFWRTFCKEKAHGETMSLFCDKGAFLQSWNWGTKAQQSALCALSNTNTFDFFFVVVFNADD